MITKVLTVHGLVQGVGFRPYVKRLAQSMSLNGDVSNTDGIVTIQIQGNAEALDEFARRLIKLCPREALIAKVEESQADMDEFTSFDIASSKKGLCHILPDIPADIATCPACEKELFDKTNRRFGHPFISCVDCGPRYSVINDIPYDRENTVMSTYNMCPDCTCEYEQIENRRCYAQTIACNSCGPVLRFNGETGSCIEKCIEAIKHGHVVAIKDIGGYHLACDALNEEAVARLRSIKCRETKPFAVMFGNVEQLEEYACINIEETEALENPARPIVLVEAIKRLAPGVSDDSRYIGAMLPCNPVQLMLMAECNPLVMTSANISGEPIITDNIRINELRNNTGIDVLEHDRDILVSLDDSIVRVICNRVQHIRNGRGFIPTPLNVEWNSTPIIAMGGDLKASFALAEGHKVILSQYMGDLEEEDNYNNYIGNIEHLKKICGFTPKYAACDMHPAYYSTKATRTMKIPVTKIQHHMAHGASVAAEHNLQGDFLAVVFDGTGYGVDGAVWGSEFFRFEDNTITRAGHLDYVKCTGGDMAARDAGNLMNSYLYKAGIGDVNELVAKAIDNNINTFTTSSMGRLFDVVSAMTGICDYNSYEGECAVKLEEAAAAADDEYSLMIKVQNGIFDISFILKQIWTAVCNNVDSRSIAAGFHQAIADYVIGMADSNNIGQIVLSGGVFMNRILTQLCINGLEQRGYKVYINEKVPCNDQGIALGQVYLTEREYIVCV